jgi:hypothetical protein
MAGLSDIERARIPIAWAIAIALAIVLAVVVVVVVMVWWVLPHPSLTNDSPPGIPSLSTPKSYALYCNNTLIPRTYTRVNTPFDIHGDNHLVVYHNPKSTSRTVDDVITFVLASNRTNDEDYNESHTCVDFAREFHLDAELNGYESNLVAIEFSDGSYHVVAELEIDGISGEAWVYIDPCGVSPEERRNINGTLRPRIGDVDVGNVYRTRPLPGYPTWTAPWENNTGKVIVALYVY